MTSEFETAALEVQSHYWVAYGAFNEAAATHDEARLKLAADALESATHEVFVTRAPTNALLVGKIKIAMQDIENRAAKEWLETIRADLENMDQNG
jgi:hypothetical protein